MYKIKFKIFLTFLIPALFVSGQTSLDFELKKDTLIKTKIDLNDGKAMLVFETDLVLDFESSIENLTKPIKKDNQYFLIVSSGPQSIKIKHHKDYSLNFGQIMDPNSMPPLKSKEILFYKVILKNNLKISEIKINEQICTETKIVLEKNKNNGVIQLFLDQNDLELKIIDIHDGIFKKIKEKGKYEIIISANKHLELLLINNEYDTTHLIISNLEPHEVKQYIIQKPTIKFQLIKDAELAAEYFCNFIDIMYKIEIFLKNNNLAEDELERKLDSIAEPGNKNYDLYKLIRDKYENNTDFNFHFHRNSVKCFKKLEIEYGFQLEKFKHMYY